MVMLMLQYKLSALTFLSSLHLFTKATSDLAKGAHYDNGKE